MKDVIAALRAAKTVVMCLHRQPDGDSIGSTAAIALALRRLGKEVTLVTPDPVPGVYDLVPTYPEYIPWSAVKDRRFDLVALFDCADERRTGAPQDLKRYAPRVLDVDHHATNTRFGDVCFIDPQAASSAEIAALRRSGVAQRQVTIYAPASGVVQQLAFHQGGYLSAQSSLMEIANLDRVWVQVALYGYQLPWVRIGDRVELRSEEFPGKLWQGRLSFLYPTQNPQSRTVTARLSFANPDGVLRPGMYVTAQVWTQAHRVLAVPDSAILRTEQGNFVMLQQAAGHFLPVQVEVGPTADGWTAISRGLHAGEKVVDNTQFLLYSESQFQSVRARMLGGNLGSKHTARTTAEHASPTAPTSKNSSASGSMAGMHMGGGGHD